MRVLIYKTSQKFPKSEVRRVSQMNASARSVKQNIAEGYKSGSLAKYKNHLYISQASLTELHEDIQDCLEDSLITKEEFEILDKLCG